MLTILSSILTTPVQIICSSVVRVFEVSTRECWCCQMLQSSLAEEKALNRRLLGLSESQTPTTSPIWMPAPLPELESGPLNPFEELLPEIQANLICEHQEHLGQNPRSTTLHPEVTQIISGSPTVNVTP
jgi:hypothetical protein